MAAKCMVCCELGSHKTPVFSNVAKAGEVEILQMAGVSRTRERKQHCSPEHSEESVEEMFWDRETSHETDCIKKSWIMIRAWDVCRSVRPMRRQELRWERQCWLWFMVVMKRQERSIMEPFDVP